MTQLPNLAFSFSFRGVIWKTAFDPGIGSLALEIRDPENFKLVYHILNLQKQTISEAIKFKEGDWWSSLLQFKAGYLLIEKYQDTQRPLHKDLLVYNTVAKSCRIFEGHQLLELDGGVLKIQNVQRPSEIKEEKLGNREAENKGIFLQPTFFETDSAEFEVVRQYLDSDELALGCEYLEWEQYIIISYYLRSGKEFERRLLVISEEEEWIDQSQDQGVKGFAPGSFFVYEKYLVFIVGKNRIDAIEL